MRETQKSYRRKLVVKIIEVGCPNDIILEVYDKYSKQDPKAVYNTCLRIIDIYVEHYTSLMQLIKKKCKKSLH